MMICLQTKVKCGHLAFCDITGKCMEQEVATMDRVDAEVRGAIQQAESPPKPTMAEIVRLIRNLIAASYNAGRSRVGIRTPEEVESCAALMAAIRLLSNSTQHGE